MKIDIRLFARAKDLAGTDRISLDLPEQATVGDLRKLLAETVPALVGLLAHSALAVDNDLAGDDRILKSTSEVALLPPVSGG
jgi:molybdopterin converting factor subunit 1